MTIAASHLSVNSHSYAPPLPAALLYRVPELLWAVNLPICGSPILHKGWIAQQSAWKTVHRILLRASAMHASKMQSILLLFNLVLQNEMNKFEIVSSEKLWVEWKSFFCILSCSVQWHNVTHNTSSRLLQNHQCNKQTNTAAVIWWSIPRHLLLMIIPHICHFFSTDTIFG